MSYAELDAHANQLAHRLIGLGVGPEVPVGVLMPRSLDLVVALLGVLKAGGAYVPMDPAYPADRLAMILEDSEVRPRIRAQTRSCTHGATLSVVAWCAGAGAAEPQGGVRGPQHRPRGASAFGAPPCLLCVERCRMHACCCKGSRGRMRRLMRSVMRLQSSHRHRRAREPQPATCATSSSRLAARAAQRAPCCSMTAP
jgi:hypothetical protein